MYHALDSLGDGLTTIMDTVESSLGVPDPNTLAEEDKDKDVESLETAKKEDGKFAAFLNAP